MCFPDRCAEQAGSARAREFAEAAVAELEAAMAGHTLPVASSPSAASSCTAADHLAQDGSLSLAELPLLTPLAQPAAGAEEDCPQHLKTSALEVAPRPLPRSDASRPLDMPAMRHVVTACLPLLCLPCATSACAHRAALCWRASLGWQRVGLLAQHPDRSLRPCCAALALTARPPALP